MAQCNAPFCCLPEARIASLNPLVVYIPTPNSGPHQRNNTPLGKVPLRGPWKRASDLEDYGVEKTVKPSSLGVKTVRVFSQKYRGVSSQFRLFLCGANRKFVSVDSANGRPCRSLLSDLPMCRLKGSDGVSGCQSLGCWLIHTGGFNHIEKYESQWEGLSHNIPYMKWKIKFMFETTNQHSKYPVISIFTDPISILWAVTPLGKEPWDDLLKSKPQILGWKKGAILRWAFLLKSDQLGIANGKPF